MKKIYLVLVLLLPLLYSCRYRGDLKKVELVNGIIPLPSKVNAFNKNLVIDSTSVIVARTKQELLAAKTLKKVFESYNLNLEIVSEPSHVKGIVFDSNAKIDSLKDEGYKITINDEGVNVLANAGAGLFYAVQSIRQLIQLNNDTVSLQFCTILDMPKYKWRGLHLDVSRHFFDVKFIKKYIDNMAKYKLNTFHWHLTDDQGWRIEIKRYPKLTSIGSMRDQTIVDKHFKPYVGDGVKYGGYYTQEQIKDIVKYAQDRFVTIVPEIEMPGHSQAALAAYPEFSCVKKHSRVLTTWGVTDTIYSPTDTTFTFLQNVLDEVMDLFPSKYIHIGGDEVPKAQWKKSKFCQNFIKEQGLKDENELQSYFITRIEKYLNSKGRYIIGWDEILEGGLAPNATVMSWRGEEGGIAAANANHDVVMTPGFVMYFDHYQGDRVQEPMAIGGFTPLKKVYDYNPMPDKIDVNKQDHVIGVQANVWTEYMKTTDYVEYMVYPRLLALAEIAWTKPQLKNWSSFQKRLTHNFELLDKYRINYRVPEPNVSFGKNNDSAIMVTIKSYFKNAKVYYTQNAKLPLSKYKLYSHPFELKKDVKGVKAYVLLSSGKKSAIRFEEVNK